MAGREGWVLCEVELLVDDEGNYAADTAAGDAAERYSEVIGTIEGPTRLVKLAVWVELPKPVTLTGEAPLMGQGAELVVK